MERPIRRLFLFFTLLFVALIVQLTYVQVWAAPKLQGASGQHAGHRGRDEGGARRDHLGGRGGAGRQPEGWGSTSCASIPQGAITSPWLGYNSLRYGRAGIERVYNEELSGQSGLLGITSYWDRILGTRAPGGRPQAHHQHGRAAGGRRGPGRPQGRRRGPRPADGGRPRHGLLSPLRPQPDRRALEGHQLRPGQAARQPGQLRASIRRVRSSRSSWRRRSAGGRRRARHGLRRHRIGHGRRLSW